MNYQIADPIIRARLEKYTVRDGSGCWIWKGHRSAKGYGKVFYNGREWTVTRLIYELNGGTLSPNIFMLHSCDNPPCVNPSHVRPGTNSENQRERFARHYARELATRRKTHCARGHELVGENLYLIPGRLARVCRTCSINRSKAIRERDRAERRRRGK